MNLQHWQRKSCTFKCGQSEPLTWTSDSLYTHYSAAFSVRRVVFLERRRRRKGQLRIRRRKVKGGQAKQTEVTFERERCIDTVLSFKLSNCVRWCPGSRPGKKCKRLRESDLKRANACDHLLTNECLCFSFC